MTLAACLLAGCSAYQATRSEDDGGHQPDGSYVLTQAEHAQDCRGLKSWIQGYADSVRKLGLQQAGRQPAKTGSIFSGLARLSGQRQADPITQSICNKYAVIAAMNRELQERGCEAVDVSATIAEVDGLRQAPAEGDAPVTVWGVQQAPTRSAYRQAVDPALCGAVIN